jgi:hypothetical protein
VAREGGGGGGPRPGAGRGHPHPNNTKPRGPPPPPPPPRAGAARGQRQAKKANPLPLPPPPLYGARMPCAMLPLGPEPLLKEGVGRGRWLKPLFKTLKGGLKCHCAHGTALHWLLCCAVGAVLCCAAAPHSAPPRTPLIETCLGFWGGSNPRPLENFCASGGGDRIQDPPSNFLVLGGGSNPRPPKPLWASGGDRTPDPPPSQFFWLLGGIEPQAPPSPSPN